jgi:hypothetical protein
MQTAHCGAGQPTRADIHGGQGRYLPQINAAGKLETAR